MKIVTMFCDKCKSPINIEKAVRRLSKSNLLTNFPNAGLCACGNYLMNLKEDIKCKSRISLLN